MFGEHRLACRTEVIGKQVLGELRVTLQEGGLDSTMELRRERRGNTFNGEARKAPLRRCVGREKLLWLGEFAQSC